MNLSDKIAERLKVRTALLGSTMYSLTWREQVTPAGRSFSRLVASARRTSARGSTLLESGWPTPSAQSPNSLRGTGQDPEARKSGGHQVNLTDAVHCAGWATPVVQQANGTPEAFIRRKKESMERGSQSMGLCLSDLNMQVQAYLSGWPSPKTADDNLSRRSAAATEREMARPGRGSNLALTAFLSDGPARLTASGELLTGSSAGMPSGGRLAPAMSLWLMLGPLWAAWLACAERVVLAKKRKKK